MKSPFCHLVTDGGKRIILPLLTNPGKSACRYRKLLAVGKDTQIAVKTGNVVHIHKDSPVNLPETAFILKISSQL